MASANSSIEARLRIALTDRQVLSVSDGIQLLLGFSAQDVSDGNVSLSSRLHPDDQDIADELFANSVAPASGTVNIRLRHADGRIRCVKGEYEKTLDESGKALILDLLLSDARSLRQCLDEQTMMTNFRAMMESADDFIFFKDRNHVFTGASQTLVAITDPAEHWTDLLGKTDYDVFPEAYADVYYRLEKQVFAGIPVAHAVQEIPRKDGTQGWVDNRKYPIHDEAGQIIGLFGIARDITERKRLDDALTESEQRFRSIFEQVPSISVQGYNRDRQVIFWNPASERLYGYTRAQALGQTLEDLIVPEPLRETAVRQMSDWADDGTAIPAGEITLKRADGQPVEVISSHVLLRNINDEPEMYRIDVDISERNRVAKALQQEQQFSRSILDSLPGIFYLYTYPDCRLVLWNKQHEVLLGYESGEMAGRHVTDWHVPEARDAVLKAITEVMEAGQSTIEAPLVAKDGRLVYFALTGVKFEAQNQLFFMGTGTDITERKHLEEQVRQMAFHDALTELPNRRLLNDRMIQALAASRRSGFYGVVMFLDLDNFKPLNDTHGHEVGDLLLIEVADRLRHCVREMDTVARFGGDEFVVMIGELAMDRAKSTAEAMLVAEKIRTTLSESYILMITQEEGAKSTIEHHCTASIGMTLFINNAVPPDDILKRADAAMYQAKIAGRNTIVIAPQPECEDRLTGGASTGFVHLVWHSSYDCGNTVIDDQHRALFFEANQLITTMLSGGQPEEIHVLIDSLIRQVIVHFNDEEAILNKIDFPGRASHAAIHRQLVDRAVGLATRFHAGNLAIGELLAFLAYDLIARHMLKVDREFFSFLKKCSV